jgi:peptide-methionine (S)-S-oxide reductase
VLSQIPDPLFREAVAAIDAGDVGELDRLAARSPRLVRDRLESYGEGYFARPYLLWFVAENPVRNGKLPGNIVDVAKAILDRAQGHGVPNVAEQVDYALSLVCSGRVARECGVQVGLIDLFADAGANLDAALLPAVAHREREAVDRLLERGASVSLPVAAGMDRTADFERLLPASTAQERQAALVAAALNGRAQAVARLLAAGADPNAFAPEGLHPHATPLHHAVDSGSRDTVATLLSAGASREARDRRFGATPLDWAEHLGKTEIAEDLRRGASA